MKDGSDFKPQSAVATVAQCRGETVSSCACVINSEGCFSRASVTPLCRKTWLAEKPRCSSKRTAMARVCSVADFGSGAGSSGSAVLRADGRGSMETALSRIQWVIIHHANRRTHTIAIYLFLVTGLGNRVQAALQ